MTSTLDTDPFSRRTRGGIATLIASTAVVLTGCAQQTGGSPERQGALGEVQQIFLDGGQEAGASMLDGPLDIGHIADMTSTTTPEGRGVVLSGLTGEDVVERTVKLQLPSVVSGGYRQEHTSLDFITETAATGSVSVSFKQDGEHPLAAQLLDGESNPQEMHEAVQQLAGDMATGTIQLNMPNPVEGGNSAVQTNCYVEASQLDGEAGCAQFVIGDKMPPSQDDSIRPVSPEAARKVVDTALTLVANITAAENGRPVTPVDIPKIFETASVDAVAETEPYNTIQDEPTPEQVDGPEELRQKTMEHMSTLVASLEEVGSTEHSPAQGAQGRTFTNEGQSPITYGDLPTSELLQVNHTQLEGQAGDYSRVVVALYAVNGDGKFELLEAIATLPQLPEDASLGLISDALQGPDAIPNTYVVPDNPVDYAGEGATFTEAGEPENPALLQQELEEGETVMGYIGIDF